MPKLDSNIYGIDSNDFAQRISSDALSQTAGDADIWGAVLDQTAMSRGTSKGTSPDTNPVKIVSNKSDSRATTKGNHGDQP